MTVAEALLSFAVIAALLTIIPGLDTALVLRAAITRGGRYAMITALGINTGALLWGIAAAVGASALLAASETAYRALTLLGAAYMVWLGISLIRKSLNRGQPSIAIPANVRGDLSRRSLVQAWATGFGTNLLNPKVGVFYIATIPQFIPEGVSPLLMGILLALLHNVLGLAWAGLIVGGAAAASGWLKNPLVARVTDRITGTVLVGFGVKLALAPH